MRSLAMQGVFTFVVVGLAGCSAAGKPTPESTDAAPAPVDASPVVTVPPPGLAADADVSPTRKAFGSGVVLVNATSAFPAFRVCQLGGTTLMRPVPTAIMPRSSVAGVDVLQAVRIEPVDFGEDTSVTLLAIDDASKSNGGLANGSCRALACTQTGGTCLGADHLKTVPIVLRGTATPAKGAFRTAGNILVLKDDGGSLRFEVEKMNDPTSGSGGDLDFDFHNLSTASGNLRYRADANDPQSDLAGQSSFRLPMDYAKATLSFAKHDETLEQIHDYSEPRVPIDTFYRLPSGFLVFFLGNPELDASAARGPRFVTIPINALPESGSADAGAD